MLYVSECRYVGNELSWEKSSEIRLNVHTTNILNFFKNLITLNLTVRPCLEVTIPNLFSPAKLQWSIFDHLSLFHFVIYINLNVYV